MPTAKFEIDDEVTLSSEGLDNGANYEGTSPEGLGLVKYRKYYEPDGWLYTVEFDNIVTDLTEESLDRYTAHLL